jgi:WD40 repeat protein
LAVQSEVGLELRDMYSGFFPQKAKVALPQTDKGVLEFSPSGKYLAGGHSQGLKVFTVPDLKIALDKPGSQATAIAFSPDGCLLAWGDAEGTVHIVNSPKP